MQMGIQPKLTYTMKANEIQPILTYTNDVDRIQPRLRNRKTNNYPVHVPRSEVFDVAVVVTWVSCPYLQK